MKGGYTKYLPFTPIEKNDRRWPVGADARGVAYVQLEAPGGRTLFGVGLSHNISGWSEGTTQPGGSKWFFAFL